MSLMLEKRGKIVVKFVKEIQVREKFKKKIYFDFFCYYSARNVFPNNLFLFCDCNYDLQSGADNLKIIDFFDKI